MTIGTQTPLSAPVNSKTQATDLKISILVVEDDPGDRLLLEEALLDVQLDARPNLRYTVECVDTVSGAEAALAARKFDVLLSDLQLPDSSAWETVRRLVAATDHSAIVLLSGMNDEKLALEAVQMGVQDYLVKGMYDPVLLARTLRYALERKQMRRRQAALAEMELTLSQPEELHELLTHICELTDELLPASGGASIILWDEATRKFQTGATTAPGSHWRDPSRQVRGASGATRWIIENCAPVIVRSLDDCKFGTNEMMKERGIQAYLGVPLMNNNKAIGVLYALEETPRAFSEADVTFLTALSHRAAAAITKVRMFEQEKQGRLLAEQLARRDRILFDATQALIRFTRTEDVIQAVLEGIVKAIGCHWVTFISLDVARRTVSAMYQHGPGESLATNVSFDELEEGLSGWVLRNGKEAISPGAQADMRESDRVRQRRKEQDIGGILVVPVIYQDQILGTITALNPTDQRDFGADDARLLKTLATHAAIAMGNARLFEQTQRLANLDTLTGMYNRRRFFELAEREVQPLLGSDAPRPCAALMFDIDHFKRVNDLYGHDCGDQVLRVVAERAKNAVRQADIIGRYGGEEFAVLMPNTNLEQASQVAERLCHAIADSPISVEQGQLFVTVSIGAAQLHRQMRGLSDLLIVADKALYAAKTNGRNRVVSHLPLAAAPLYAEVAGSVPA